MDIKQLKYFVEIVQHKSMTEAANQLYMSQSTLSKAIRDLEKELNTSLFTRQNRRLLLTDEGKLLYDKSLELIRIYNQLPDELHQKDGNETGHIRFGLSTIADANKFMNTFQAYHDRYPKITYQLTQGGGKSIEQKILSDQLDLGITSLPVDTNNFDYLPIYKEYFYIVLLKNHALSSKNVIKLNDLKEESFIMFDEAYYINDLIQTVCRQHGFVPNVIAKITQWNIIEYLITSNIGVTILPENIAKTLNKNPEISIVPIEKELLSWEIGVIWKKNIYLNHVSRKWIDYMTIHLNQ